MLEACERVTDTGAERSVVRVHLRSRVKGRFDVPLQIKPSVVCYFEVQV